MTKGITGENGRNGIQSGRKGNFLKMARETEPEAIAGVAAATIETIEQSEIRNLKTRKRKKIYLENSEMLQLG